MKRTILLPETSYIVTAKKTRHKIKVFRFSTKCLGITKFRLLKMAPKNPNKSLFGTFFLPDANIEIFVTA